MGPDARQLDGHNEFIRKHLFFEHRVAILFDHLLSPALQSADFNHIGERTHATVRHWTGKEARLEKTSGGAMMTTNSGSAFPSALEASSCLFRILFRYRSSLGKSSDKAFSVERHKSTDWHQLQVLNLGIVSCFSGDPDARG
eukprot:747107-Hanusia_phi.AAC.3